MSVAGPIRLLLCCETLELGGFVSGTPGLAWKDGRLALVTLAPGHPCAFVPGSSYWLTLEPAVP